MTMIASGLSVVVTAVGIQASAVRVDGYSDSQQKTNGHCKTHKKGGEIQSHLVYYFALSGRLKAKVQAIGY